jgi:proton glutamate symport protein
MNSLKRQLWFQVLIAMTLGLAVGLLLAPTGAGLLSKKMVEQTAPWIALPGNVFLALIKMVVIPLVLSSIILGLSSSPDPDFLRKAALRVFPYFVGTTVVAIVIGIGLTLFIEPGKYIDSETIKQVMEGSQTTPVNLQSNEMHLADRIVRLIPPNYVKVALEQDMLAAVVLAVIIGLALAAAKPETKERLLTLFQAAQEIALIIIGWAMKLAPIAVFALICTITMRIGFGAIAGMTVYIGTVLLGLIVVLVFYLVMVFFFAKMHPLSFLQAIRDVQLLAFSTSSSAAVMPVSLETAEKKLRVEPSIARFIIPLGATINMDGTALYQVTAAVFLTQVFGVPLTIWSLIALTATTVGASIGTPSTPGVGIVVLASILQGIGVPSSGIALIIGVDRILDMSRTTVNVTGDLTACAIMNRWFKTKESEARADGDEVSRPVGEIL